MATTFPAGLVPQAILFDIQNVSRSGGISTNGMEQIVGSGVGRWAATLSDIPIRSNAQVLAWRAFKAALRGRAGTILVPVFDGKRTPWPVDAWGRVLHPGFTRHKGLNGTQYADPDVPAQSEVIATMSAAAVRATTVSIAVTQGSAPQEGQYFSPAAGRLHVITESLGGGTYRIEPPLRSAVSAGTAVNFTRPTCEMRLAADDEGKLDLQLARTGTVTLNMVEAV